ncbi:MAG: TMEM175 family protein [Steroidobacteraceae bacterium]
MAETHRDHPLERLELFADAVFAIAITLLVIEIHVPELPRGSTHAAYWQELKHLLPSFFGYVLSFLVIGRIWMVHHAAFMRARRFQPSFLWPNILLLLLIAFMPFATAFLTKNLGQFVPALFYNLTLVMVALLTLRVVRVVTREAHAEAAGADAAELRFFRVRPLAMLLAALLAVVLGLWLPPYSQLALLTTPLWLMALRRLFGARTAR